MDIVERLRDGRLDPPLRSYNELHNAAADEIERLRAVIRPIPVTERLPPVSDNYAYRREEQTIVLAFERDEWYRALFLKDGTWWPLDFEDCGARAMKGVTHWMPLPPRPVAVASGVILHPTPPHLS